MAEQASLIDAVKLVAKAAKEKPDETSSVVRGALHEDQIDAVRVVSKARDGSLAHLVAPQGSTATPAAASTDDPGVLHLRSTSDAEAAWTAKGTPNKVPAEFQGAAPPANTGENYPPLPAAAPTTWRQADRARSRQRASRRDKTPHPATFATPEEVAAMSPNSRLIYDTQMSLHRQEEQMKLRHQAEVENLHMSMEEDLVNRFRSSLVTSKAAARAPPAPTPQEEATTGGASSSTATLPRRPPWAEAWQPDTLPLQELQRPATPRLDENRKVRIDPRGTYPTVPGAGKGAATGKDAGAGGRATSKERKLAKKLPAGVPLSAMFIDEQGRADMSWRNVPDNEKPPGALCGPGHGKGKGVGKYSHAMHPQADAWGPGDIMARVNPRDPAIDPAEFIPEMGSITYQEGLTGRGRYDTWNGIFRCVIRCPHCRASLCNRRMWFFLDNHGLDIDQGGHYCRECQNKLGLGGQPD